MTILNKVLIEIFEFLVHLIFISLLIILTFFILRQSIILPLDSRTYLNNDVGEYVIGGVQGENIIVQTFRSSVPIEQIEVRLATYDRVNPGEIYIRVIEPQSESEIQAITVPANEILDNAYYKIKLNKPLSPRVEYALEIAGQSPNTYESVGVWSSYSDIYSNGKLTISGLETEGDIAFRLISDRQINLWGKIINSIFFSALFALVIYGYLLYQKKFATNS